MYDTVLVPVDGSEHATRAAEHGLAVAEVFDATIHVINVVDVQAAAGVFDAGGVDAEFVARLENAGQEAIDTVTRHAGETDTIRTAVLRGDPSEAILEYAEKHDIELLVMGTHGRTGLSRYLIGSVTEDVVRHASIPVLTVQETERSRINGEYDEILIPTDGSEYAAVAIEPGLTIAQRTDARIHAVTIVDSGGRDRWTRPSTAELTDRLESEGKAATEQIATRARDAGCDAVTTVREGSPASALLEYTDMNDIDLIAMGTAGRTGLNRFLLGSTTERIIRHADVPVLAVNARGRVKD